MTQINFRYILSISLFLLFTFLLTWVFFIPYNDIGYALLGSLASVSLLLPIFTGIVKRDFLWWNPVNFFCIILFLAYPLRFIQFYLFPDDAPPELFIPYLKDKFLSYEIIFVTLFAGLSYFIGNWISSKIIKNYDSSTKKILKKLSNLDDVFLINQEIHFLYNSLLICIVFGLSARFLAIALGVYSGFTNVSNPDALVNATPLFILDEYNRIAFAIAWISLIISFRIRIPINLRFISLIYLIQELLFLLFVRGSKTFLLLFMIFPLFYYAIDESYKQTKTKHKKIIPSWIMYIVLGIIGYYLLTIIFDFVLIYRYNYIKIVGYEFQLSPNLIEVTTQTLSDMLAATYQDNASFNQGATVGERFTGADTLAYIINQVPKQVNFVYFQDVLIIPLSFIPRFILPFKPAPILGRIAIDELGNGYSGLSLFIFGEGYLNWGLLGVVLTMFSFAFFHNFMISLLKKFLITQRLFICFLPLLFYAFFSPDSTLITGISKAITMILAFSPIWYLVYKFGRKLKSSILI
ncbi:MAG: oligosaccharide repeat unit polymerase [Nostocaceae cyanobacterium]|nr:oligosaccharide repeat unit polymerase [Nostocaceae cyanobacterium]